MTIICPCCGEEIEITVKAETPDDHFTDTWNMVASGKYEFGVVPDSYDEQQNTDQYNPDMKGGEIGNGK